MKLLRELYNLVEEDKVEDEDLDNPDEPSPKKKDKEETDSSAEKPEEEAPEDSEDSEDSEDDEDTDEGPVEGEDVGSVADLQGFEKSKKEMYAFGATRPVTLLTKQEREGGMDVTFQYVINPKTGGWKLQAKLANQNDSDYVEFTTGEDPSSLIKSLKKKKKVTPHQLVDNLNPPQEIKDKVDNPKPKEESKDEDNEE